MKVYIATSGEYSDYCICRVFARREDAEAYPSADHVEEYEVTEGPADVRPRYNLQWCSWLPDRETSGIALENPHAWSYDLDFYDSVPPIFHSWHETPSGPRLQVQGWDRDRVMKVYSEQRAKHLAEQAL